MARVQSLHGLHARPSHAVVSLAMGFDLEIELEVDGRIADANSVLSVMTLGAVTGAEVQVRASGKGAQEAVDAMVALIESDFGEGS
jgi:phosphocarrier protein